MGYPLQYSWASLVAQMIRNLPAMQETWVQSQGWENPLEKEMEPIPVLPGNFHEHRSLAGSMGSQTFGYNWANNTFTFTIPKLCFMELYKQKGSVI